MCLGESLGSHLDLLNEKMRRDKTVGKWNRARGTIVIRKKERKKTIHIRNTQIWRLPFLRVIGALSPKSVKEACGQLVRMLSSKSMRGEEVGASSHRLCQEFDEKPLRKPTLSITDTFVTFGIFDFRFSIMGVCIKHVVI